VLVAQRYRLEDSLGRGGMGEVWRGTDEVLGRQVAVKLLHPFLAGETAADRFRMEAKAESLVHDPHVIEVLDFGTDEHGLFLVMELVEGRSVAEELAEHGAMDPDRAADIVAQAAAGLGAAHRQGVIHRDIKPGNLLLTADGTVKVADFGIARLASDPAAALTLTGEIIGTSHYLAPERALGRPAGPEADVYSLGCVLYQLVTGDPPFQADAPAAVAYQHVDTEPVPPGELRPGLTDAFEEFLLTMLAKDPADRPTAQQVADWSPACQHDETDTETLRAKLRRSVRPTVVAATLAAGLGLRH
jgi:serine/threonine protein kinase